jgi:hypothetical protein
MQDETHQPFHYDPRSDLPTGWAVSVDGVISLRTASYRPEAAMINSIILHGDIEPLNTTLWTDEMINLAFAKLLLAREDKKFELVRVMCVETPE